MNTTSPNPDHCAQCGTALPDAPGGLCPRCLMEQLVQPTVVDEAMAAMAPIPPEELTPLFPQLEILECLGRGGMGVVYKARQKSLNRLVALKLLAPERAGDADFAARFAREAQALAALNHPNIVAVYDFGEAGGFYFLLMEFVDGLNLRQLLRTKRLTPQEALSIVPPVCDALQCAHNRGIVHRDIKPENLLLDRAGNVKIADFGIARMMGDGIEPLTDSAAATAACQTFNAGTPAYAAPEQRNGTADHRADIYSLGVVLYEMLTGERPKDKLEPPSRRVQVDVRIDEIVLRALEKTPELRFATVAEFRTKVDEARAPVVRARRWSPAKWAAIFVTGIAAAAVAYTTVTQQESNSPPAQVQPAPATLADAVAQLESEYSALLLEERAAAMAATPAERTRTEPRLTELRQRVQELETAILKFSNPTKSPTPHKR